MAKDDEHPNLRQRRNAIGDNGEDASSLLKSESRKDALYQDKALSDSNSNPTSISTCGYVLTGLQRRSLISRLDVGPFFIAYASLVFLDFYMEEDTLGEAWISSVSSFGFPLVLLAHFGLFLLQQWNVSWRALVAFRKADDIYASRHSSNKVKRWTHCLVEAPHVDQHHSKEDQGIVPVSYLREVSGDSSKQQDTVMVVNFQDVIFRCKIPMDDTTSQEDDDSLLWATKEDTDSAPSPRGFHRLKYPIDRPLSFYREWRGHTCMRELVKAQQTYGSNTTIIEMPPFFDLLQEQLLAPFFLFQVFCVLLWSLDEYWYYAMFTLFALLMFESTMAYNRLKSLERLRSHTVPTNKLVWVYRPSYPPGDNGWVQVLVTELVPGDLVSCKHVALINRGGSSRRQQESSSNLAQKEQQLNRIPADILIVKGDAVVDESLLTGESVPQLKVPLEMDSSATSTRVKLDLQDQKQSMLFGGTTLMVGESGQSSLSGLPDPPDRGLVGMVLRTGFETAQGALLRTMAHTQKSVDGIHTSDTYVFILVLLLCAVVSAAVVWEEGWNDPTRNKFRLGLHVIIIITSVIPPELPIELNLAVTNSLADLIKRKIFCTEAFRIPLAGQIDICCFDKTGTLTVDQIFLTGISLAGMENDSASNEIDFTNLQDPIPVLPWPTLRVMVGCHSLSARSGGDDTLPLIGDPLEKAVMEKTGYKLLNNDAMQKINSSDGPDTVLILQRFAFSSKVKRMSTLVRESGCDKTWVLTKGAPEIVKTLLRSSEIPSNYDAVSMSHMAKGQRVLAIAYRELTPTETKIPVKNISRETVESDLVFAGFLLFRCPIKHDSKSIITELKQSGNKVVMITGDAMLTAVEVGRQVSIIPSRRNTSLQALQLQYVSSGENSEKKKNFLDDFKFVPFPGEPPGLDLTGLSLNSSGLALLREKTRLNEIALCISGDVLDQLVSMVVKKSDSRSYSTRIPSDDKQTLLHPDAQALLKEIVPLVKIYARHAPRQKEAVIAAFNLGGFKTLMCGDGTNDVGALRRAHVGISLISAPEIEAKQHSAVQRIAKSKNAAKKAKRVHAKQGSRPQTTSTLEKSLRQLQEAQDELDQIDLGDASIASPFTSRVSGISCCKDVIKQGRCTLVTMLQIYKILGVNCLVNATILSKLFLHGVKQGDRQMTALGLIVAALFFFVTRGKPLPNLSAVRPPTSVLCLQAIVSISVQFLIHFSAMIVATEAALSFVDPFDPSLIPDGPFNPNTLNTCTFLVSVLATVNTFAVNYRGEPFVEPLRQNKLLWRSLLASYMILFSCTFEVFPPLNDVFQLAEFPDPASELEGWKEQTTSHGIVMSILTEFVCKMGFPGFLAVLMTVDTLLVFSSERLILKFL